jgi:Rrf2 family protein
MAELAVAYPEGAVSVKELASKQRLSAKYLEQIMSSLKAAGLVRSVRGTHGGYTLARSPARINLSEVYQVLEGSPAPVDCVDSLKVCSMARTCPTRDTWVEIKEAISSVLDGTTLQNLADRVRRK